MHAYLLHGKEDLRRAELPVPAPEAGQVVVKIRCVGICGSDIHYYNHGRVGAFVPKRPFALGHEFAGEVVALGPGFTGLPLGTRVAVDPSQPCGHCRHCREGRYNLCAAMRYFGSASCDPHLDGGFAQQVAVPARNCHPLPATLSWGEAAMLEPLSVALHAIQRAGGVTGRSVCIAGGGAIGQLIALAARAFGAARITVLDLAPFPRRLALELGADAALDPTDPALTAPESLGEGCDVVFEAVGSGKAAALALQLARRGGTVVQVGTLPPEVPLPANLIMSKELTVVGSFRFANVFPLALDLLAGKRIRVAPLISQTFPFDQIPEAMARAVGKGDVVKIQVAS